MLPISRMAGGVVVRTVAATAARHMCGLNNKNSSIIYSVVRVRLIEQSACLLLFSTDRLVSFNIPYTANRVVFWQQIITLK